MVDTWHYAFVKIHEKFIAPRGCQCVNIQKKKPFRRLGNPRMKCRIWQYYLTVSWIHEVALPKRVEGKGCDEPEETTCKHSVHGFPGKTD